MDTFIFIGVMVIAVILLFWKLHKAPSGENSRTLARPTEKRPATRSAGGEADPQTRFVEPISRKPYQLLNASEQTLYHQLQEAMPNMIIFAQVGMAQLAQLRGRQSLEDMRPMIGRSVDFLVCREDFAILAAIELVWPASESSGKPDPEIMKRAALERLGIPLIVFRPNQLPDPETIGREIAEAIVRRNLLEAERERRARGQPSIAPTMKSAGDVQTIS